MNGQGVTTDDKKMTTDDRQPRRDDGPPTIDDRRQCPPVRTPSSAVCRPSSAHRHSVRDLARQCESHDGSFGALAGDAALLDQFYIPTRYPNGLPSPAVPGEAYTEAQAQTAQDAAAHVLSVAGAFLEAHASGAR